MKTVILAGGQQSTICGENEGVPKPMAILGGRPIIWHIMKLFSSYGFNDFIVCAGYKINIIKEYFMDYYVYESDITVDLKSNTIQIHKKKTEDWKVTIVDTGLYSSTGQRIAMVEDLIGKEDFIVTYGDCISNIDVESVINFHNNTGKIASLVVTKPSGRNELLPFDENGNINSDKKDINLLKKINDNAWINAYTMIFNNKIFDYLKKNNDLERELIYFLSEKEELAIYRHNGFWRAVETLRDRDALDNMWINGVAPWKIWRD